MIHYPPAVSQFNINEVRRRYTSVNSDSLDKAIQSVVGCKDVICANSWVILLVETLNKIKSDKKDEIILPSYSCGEFTKAILLANLKPRYVDLGKDLKSDIKLFEKAINDKTLAIISINNIGIESDNHKLKSICEKNNVFCLEDATYTFLGKSDFQNAPFGSIGDISIVNFSEGKMIPIGGGAILLNNKILSKDFNEIKQKIYSLPKNGEKNELISLYKYKVGSSKIGFSIYKNLKNIMSFDMKKKFSMESTRTAEIRETKRDGGIIYDMGFKDNNIFIPHERKVSLQSLTAGPLNRPKIACGLDVINNIIEYSAVRRQNFEMYKEFEHKFTKAKLVDFPKNGICVKAPVLFKNEPKKDYVNKLESLGLLKQYTKSTAMYNFKELKNCRYYYECAYTLPVHPNINYGVIKKLAKCL